MLHKQGGQHILQFSYMSNLFGNDYRAKERRGYLRVAQLPSSS